MALATIEDFEARHGEVSDKRDRVEVLLGDASAFILAAVDGSTEPWAMEDDDADIPADVVAICVQVAFRAWHNPLGIAREQLGEAAVTYRGDDQPDVLRLTRAERATLRRAAGLAKGGVLGSVGVETSFAGPAAPNDLVDS